MPHAPIVAPLRAYTANVETLGPVIVAVGGRDPSAALHAARVFARLSPAGVLALSVLEPLPIHAFGEEPRLPPPSFDAEREAALEARLEALVREASGEPGAWRMEVQLGDPAHVIADVAARERSPLIIMGIGRHSVVDRLLQRETVIRTIRLARSPVLAVSGAIASPPQRVVVGTDFSAESALAAQAALSLMGDEGSVVFMHAWRSAATADPFFSEVLRTADDEYERLLPARFERMHALVSAPAGITLRDLTCRGDSAQELLHHAERLDADLIAVGRHGIGALERLILGSVASSVLRGAKCSVLVTPTPTGIERERLEIRVRAAAEFTSPETWAGMLARFTQRNRGRTTQLEEENPDLGTQTQEAGFAFAGAAYDAKDGRVELMFGDSAAARPHLTRAIAAAHLITVNTDERSMDTGLGIDHGRGRTFLRFTSAPRHRA